MGYFKDIFVGGLSLIEGMGVTIRRIYKPVVTVQYPRQHIPLSPAYRGHIELKIFPDTGTHKCIACGTCEKMCPTGVISVKGVKGEAKGAKVATDYVIEFARCSLCGLCVESCPTDTLEYSKEYQLAHDSKTGSVIDLMERLKQRKAQLSR